MKRLIPLALLAILSAPLVYSQNQSAVDWQSHEGSLEQAAEEGKPVLYLFDANWCGYCRKLNSEVFSVAAHAKTIEDNFITVRVTDQSREKGANVAAIEALHRRYAVRSFPTLVVARADGSLIGRSVGYFPPTELMAWFETQAERANPAEGEKVAQVN